MELIIGGAVILAIHHFISPEEKERIKRVAKKNLEKLSNWCCGDDLLVNQANVVSEIQQSHFDQYERRNRTTFSSFQDKRPINVLFLGTPRTEETSSCGVSCTTNTIRVSNVCDWGSQYQGEVSNDPLSRTTHSYCRSDLTFDIENSEQRVVVMKLFELPGLHIRGKDANIEEAKPSKKREESDDEENEGEDDTDDDEEIEVQDQVVSNQLYYTELLSMVINDGVKSNEEIVSRDGNFVDLHQIEREERNVIDAIVMVASNADERAEENLKMLMELIRASQQRSNSRKKRLPVFLVMTHKNAGKAKVNIKGVYSKIFQLNNYTMEELNENHAERLRFVGNGRFLNCKTPDENLKDAVSKSIGNVKIVLPYFRIETHVECNSLIKSILQELKKRCD